MRAEAVAHQTVSLESLHQGVVSVRVQHEAVSEVLHEVQVLEGGPGLLSLLFGGPPLVRGALEVILEVHAHHPRQDVVHDTHTDVLAARLHAVQAIELGKQCARVLV